MYGAVLSRMDDSINYSIYNSRGCVKTNGWHNTVQAYGTAHGALKFGLWEISVILINSFHATLDTPRSKSVPDVSDIRYDT
jgi:hypothetical protein